MNAFKLRMRLELKDFSASLNSKLVWWVTTRTGEITISNEIYTTFFLCVQTKAIFTWCYLLCEGWETEAI